MTLRDLQRAVRWVGTCLLLSAPSTAFAEPPEVDTAQATQPAQLSDQVVPALLELDLGASARVIDLPTAGGLFRLDTGFVPAFGLKLASRVHGERFLLGVLLAYQSTLAASATQDRSDPRLPPLTSSIRSSHLEGGVSPGIRLGSGRDSASLAVFAGYGVRALATVVELQMPRFTLHGPVLRVELELPLASNAIVLRLAPEAQLIVSLSRDLRRAGIVDSPGVALGGEASVRLALSAWASAQIAYRESHAFSKTAFDASFTDVERYLLLSGIFRYF